MMARLLIAFLAALLAAIYSALSAGLFDAALLAFFAAIQKRHAFAGILDSGPVWEAARGIVIASIFAFLLFQLQQMRRATIETWRWDGPGKVLLFPGRTSHARIYPQKHSFAYSYLTVGIPVGFEGNAGGMVSVETQGKPFRVPKAWFTIDAGDYLERGKSELGLRGKLDEYLRTQVCLLSV